MPFRNANFTGNGYISGFSGEADLNSNSNSLNGLLQKITYPTGGTSEFVYENNTFNFEGVDVISGGARVKSQILNDGNGSIIEKKYDYSDKNGKSSGTILNFPKIADITLWNSQTKTLTFQTYSYNKGAIELTQGAYIGYSRVIEKIEGQGRTEYLFNSAKEYPNEYETSGNIFFPKHSYYPGLAFTDHDNRRGTIAHKYIYDHNGIKLLEENYLYNNYKVIDSKIREYRLTGFDRDDIGYFRFYGDSQSVKIVNSINLPSSKETIEYFAIGKQLKTKVEYGFNGVNVPAHIEPHYNLSYERLITPSNDIIEKKIIYPRDIQHGANQPAQYHPSYRFLASMIAKKMWSVPIITSNYKNDVFVKRDQIIFENYTNNMFLPKEYISYSEDKTFVVNGVTLPDLNFGTKEISFDRYDSKGNILQYTRKGDLPVSIIWGYNNTLPIAKIEGAVYSEIAPSPYITSIISASNVDIDYSSEQDFKSYLNSFRQISDYSKYFITTYTYDPLIGQTSITSPNGSQKVYIYDAANRLKEIRKNDSGEILEEYKYNYKQ